MSPPGAATGLRPRRAATRSTSKRTTSPGYRSIKGVHARLDALDAAGLIQHPVDGFWPGLKRYAAADQGKPAQSLILEPGGFTNYNKGSEWTGYPTQKPLALYERIIKASSNEGDLVLDPFAGCATTCVAAERLGRQWIGVDLNEPAAEIIHSRLQREARLPEGADSWDRSVRVEHEPPKRTDAGEAVAPELVVVSRKRNAPRLPVRVIREQLSEEFGMRCQGCGWVPPYLDHLEVDHKKPRSLGGRDEMPNYALLCGPCNDKKSNKLTLTELQQKRQKEGRIDAEWWDEQKWK